MTLTLDPTPFEGLKPASSNPRDAICLARGALDQVKITSLTPVQLYLFGTAVGAIDNLLTALVEPS